MKKKIKTIDCTPTWQAACEIYINGLMNGSPKGQQLAIEGLRHMAKVAQSYVDMTKEIAGETKTTKRSKK